MLLPNITSFSMTSWSTYVTLTIDDDKYVTLAQRPDGSMEAYSYIKGIRFEAPAWSLGKNLLNCTIG